jgi:O-antigen ligase/polysaccharide polymerase Wzy-like membrane protein
MGTPGITLFGGVALLTLAAPFELTEPFIRLPLQSITSLEAALLLAFAGWGAFVLASRRLPRWQTPLTLPWVALLIAMVVSSAASPVSRANALHMTGRLAAALGVYLLAVNGLTTRSRLRAVLALAVAVGVVVSVLAILEYLGVSPVLAWLTAFRPGVATVGAQVRAGGPLQYPTIASMYLEVVFAFGLGLLLSEHDAVGPGRRMRVVASFVALVVIGEAITLTFTRAGLITMATSLALVGAIRHSRRGVDAGTLLVAGLALVIATLFLASRSTQSMWLRFTSEGQESWYRAKVDAPEQVEIPAGRWLKVPVTLANTGRLLWDSAATPPILASYHWLPADGEGFVAFEGHRTAFASPIAPGSAVTLDVRVRAPEQPGRYRVEWDLVQEGRLWFSTEAGAARVMSRAVVTGDAAADAAPDALTPPPRPTSRPGRLTLWRAAAKMFAARPLLGVGPDNFRLVYGTYAGLPSADPRTHSNNMYLEMFAGGGVVVGVAFLWLFWRAAGSFARLARGGAAQDIALALGIAAAGLAIAVHAAVDSFLSFAPIYVMFSLTLGCAVACARGAEDRSHANRV